MEIHLPLDAVRRELRANTITLPETHEADFREGFTAFQATDIMVCNIAVKVHLPSISWLLASGFKFLLL